MLDIFRTREANDKKSRVLILGPSGVGKTSLKTRYIKGNFRKNELMTIGVEMDSAVIQVDGVDLRIELYDIAGQEAFQLQKKLVKNIQGVMIVFDLTRQETLFAIRSWVDKVFDISPKLKAPILFVANKLDLKNEREIPEDEIQKLIEIIRQEKHVVSDHIDYIETSAKTGENIERAFEKLAKDIFTVYFE